MCSGEREPAYLIRCLTHQISNCINLVLVLVFFQNGIFSSLPFLSMMGGIGVASILADYVRSRSNLRITTIRKIFQVTGNVYRRICRCCMYSYVHWW